MQNGDATGDSLGGRPSVASLSRRFQQQQQQPLAPSLQNPPLFSPHAQPARLIQSTSSSALPLQRRSPPAPASATHTPSSSRDTSLPPPRPRIPHIPAASGNNPGSQSNRISVSRLSRLFDTYAHPPDQSEPSSVQPHPHLDQNATARRGNNVHPAWQQLPHPTAATGMRRDLPAPTVSSSDHRGPSVSSSRTPSVAGASAHRPPPPIKPPKPAALSTAAASPALLATSGTVAATVAALAAQANTRLRAKSSPTTTTRPPSLNPFLSQSERSENSSPTLSIPAAATSNEPSNVARSPPSNPFAAENDTNADQQHDTSSLTDHHNHAQNGPGSHRPVSAATIELEHRMASLSKLGGSFAPKVQTTSISEQVRAARTTPKYGGSVTFATMPRLTSGSVESISVQPPTPSTDRRERSASDAQTPSGYARTPYNDSMSKLPFTKDSALLDPIVYPAASGTIQRDTSQDSLSSVASRNAGLSPSEVAEKRAKKRMNVVQEIIDTERSFLSDMRVLVDVYATPSQQTGVLPATDHKLLFGHLNPVIETSDELLNVLEAAATDNVADQWIGDAFNQMMKKIETVYCDYCKHQDAALSKLSEYASPAVPEPIRVFLESSRAKLQGRTTAWDLSSLIVKPVQRVLKYPLLIRSLIKETETDHTDYPNLVQAFTAIERVADKINEVKKRKDIVDKYVTGKGGVNVIHGITKRINRSAQQLKMKTGLAEESRADELYNALSEKLVKQYDGLMQLQKDLQVWVETVRDYCVAEETIASCLEDVYFCEADVSGSSTTIRDVGSATTTTPGVRGDVDMPSLVRTYRTTCERLLGGPYHQLETQVRNAMFPAIDRLLGIFKEPMLLMKKRDAKLLDYERVNTAKSRGDIVDKLLAESAEAYPAINAQLIEELPVFMNIVMHTIHEILIEVMMIQHGLYAYLRDHAVPLAETIGLGVGEDMDAMKGKFRDHMAVGGPIEVATRDMALMQRWRAEIWGFYIDTGGNAPGSPVSSSLSLSRRGGNTGGGHQHSDSVGSSALVDLSGSVPAPRTIRSDVDTDAVLRRTILVSNRTLQPTQAPLPSKSSLSSSTSSLSVSTTFVPSGVTSSKQR